MKRIYISIVVLFVFALKNGAQDFNKDGTPVRICVNPGHGGFDSDDRNMVIYPFTSQDPNGFWESQSNLDKGLFLTDLLRQSNAEVILTRTENRTVDDLGLGVIVEMANVNNCDFMLSIHSNAGVNNYILMICTGKDADDTHQYAETVSPENTRISHEVGEVVAKHLFTNQVSCWFSAPRVVSDKTFARTALGYSNGYGVLRRLQGPGMISEGAMHDYTPETYRLMNMDYKHMEAWHFYKSFCEYFDAGEQNIGKVAGWIKDKWGDFNDAFPVAQNYSYQKGTDDAYMPLNEVKVELLLADGNTVLKEYMTDQMYNGFFMFDSIQPGNYKLKMSKIHYQDYIQDVVVKSNEITYANTFLDKDRSEPLVVKSFYPNSPLETLVSAGTHITFDFNFEVDPSSLQQGFHIEPAVQGEFIYKKFQRTAVFVPDAPLETNMVYTVTLDKSVKHVGGLSMEADLTFQFKTKGVNKFEVLDSYPKNGDIGVYPNTLVKFYFSDKLMPLSNLFRSFSLIDADGNDEVMNAPAINMYPGELGEYTFRGYLKPNTSYIVKMDKGVSSVDSLLISEDYQFGFTTGSDYIPTEGQVDDFEVKNLFTLDMNKTNNINPDVTVMIRYSTLAITGSRSYQLFYEFTSDDACVTANYSTPSIVLAKDDIIGTYIYGDLSYNDLSYIISDGLTDKEYPVTTMDYAGWKLCEVKMDDLEAGKEYKMKGLSLKSTGTPYSKGGLILFDNMMKYQTSLTDIQTEKEHEQLFTVYPNPAIDQLFINYPMQLDNVACRIFALDGRLINETKIDVDNKVSISGLASGSYLIQVLDGKFNYVTMFVKK